MWLNWGSGGTCKWMANTTLLLRNRQCGWCWNEFEHPRCYLKLVQTHYYFKLASLMDCTFGVMQQKTIKMIGSRAQWWSCCCIVSERAFVFLIYLSCCFEQHYLWIMHKLFLCILLLQIFIHTQSCLLMFNIWFAFLDVNFSDFFFFLIQYSLASVAEGRHMLHHCAAWYAFFKGQFSCLLIPAHW